MKHDSEQSLVRRISEQLDRHGDALDELTRARLKAARMRAFEVNDGHSPVLWPLAVLTTAAVALLAVLIWNLLPGHAAKLPEDWEAMAVSEELELIDELDFYVWLEEIEASG